MTALYLHAAGAVTALGLDLDWTVASLRAGLDAFRRVPFQGATGNDLQAAPIVGFAEGLGGVQRYVALAERAIAPCLVGLRPNQRARTAVLLGLPRPQRPGVPEALASRMGEHLAALLGLAQQAIVPISLGRVSVFGGLAQAQRLLADGRCEICIVGGVDVLTNGDSLRGLADAGLLKEDWDGLIAGEGAAFVRVATTPGPGPWGDCCARIGGVAAVTEPAVGTAADPLIGRGVNAAFKAAMQQAALPDTSVSLHINDINGARADFEDNAMGLTRFFRAPDHEYEVWHLASYLGETGAACGAIQLAWGQAALDLGFARSQAILMSTSDGDIRAAAVLQSDGAVAAVGERRQVSVARVVLHAGGDDSAAHAPADRGLALPTDTPHDELVQRHLRELGWLWEVRTHHLNEGDNVWSDIHSYEQRLLPHLDALAWSCMAGRRRLRDAWNSDDAADVAAATLVLLATPLDAARAATVLARAIASERHLQVLAAVLPHAPAPVFQPLIERCVAEGSPELVKLGLRAIATAQWHGGIEPVRAALASNDPSIVVAAIQCAAMVGLTEAVEAIRERIRDFTQRGVDLLQGAMTRVALMSLGLTGVELALLDPMSLARASPLACALHCLRENEPLGRYIGNPLHSVATLDACGWVGEAALVPGLLGALASAGDLKCAYAAARSLVRISGLAPCPQRPAARDKAADDPVSEVLSVDPVAWRAALEQAGLLDSSARRFRHGIPWHSASAIAHLQRPTCLLNERWVAAWEHAVIHRRGLPIHPEQFVKAQCAALDRLAAC